MIIDSLIGMFLVLVGLRLGYENNSFFLLGFAFILDIDLVMYEIMRIARKEKKFSIKNFLDEWSFKHKFIAHHPLPVIVISIIVWLIVDWLFALLALLALVGHLIHDTLDENFDGVRWAFPFNRFSYKIRFKDKKIIIIKRSPEELYNIAQKRMVNNPRTATQLLKKGLRG
jgi:hypothetical protein